MSKGAKYIIPIDNSLDMWSRGRGNPAQGERHARAILTDHDVLAIRQAALGGTDFACLARQYGVAHSTIGAAATGERWKHLPAETIAPTPGHARGERVHGAKLTHEQAIEIKRLIAAGVGNRSIVDRYGVKHVTISAIRRGRIWAHVEVVA